MKQFIISTTSLLDGFPIKAYLDVVNINIVIGTNFFSDFAASFTDVFGGNSETYQNKMNQMYENAKSELTKKAKRIGGNAIIGLRVDFDEISGKGKSMFMLSASGTACIVDMNNNQVEITEQYQIVSHNSLMLELRKDKILENLQSQKFELSEDDWNYLFEYPSKDIIELLICSFYPDMMSADKRKTETLVKTLDYEDACQLVYPLYMKTSIKKDSVGNEYDESLYYEKIIRNCNLFDPQYILNLIDENVTKAVSILNTDKQFYNVDDLKAMKSICQRLDNLPNLGEISTGKTGMFSKEKELYICRNGHKTVKSLEFCTTCGENIKGLKHDQVLEIKTFKKKVDTLSKLLSDD
ncbi:MAG: YbjQ family protein [Bacteroidaceae bacterium]|nr:YbjQ family protein [Bacteroidaceae bacterium]